MPVGAAMVGYRTGMELARFKMRSAAMLVSGALAYSPLLLAMVLGCTPFDMIELMFGMVAGFLVIGPNLALGVAAMAIRHVNSNNSPERLVVYIHVALLILMMGCSAILTLVPGSAPEMTDQFEFKFGLGVGAIVALIWHVVSYLDPRD